LTLTVAMLPEVLSKATIGTIPFSQYGETIAGSGWWTCQNKLRRLVYFERDLLQHGHIPLQHRPTM
jgi:hypothetical protein